MFTAKRPRRRVLTATLVASTVLALAACGGTTPSPSSSPTSTSTVTDGSGTSVTVKSPVSRVVCLTGICDDALLELGLRPVASREAGAHELLAQPQFLGPGEAEKIPTIGGSFGQENVEDVIVARPDLVIGLEGVHDGLRSAIEQAAPLYLAKVSSYQDSIDFLTWMGGVTGRQEQAADAVERFNAKLATAHENRSTLTSIAIGGVDANFNVSTDSSLLGSVLQEVGNYPWEDTAGGSHEPGTASYSLEQILQTNPDVIFVSTIAVSSAQPTPISELLASNPVWSQLAAVQNHHVVETNSLIWATGRGTRSLGIVLDQAQQELADAG
ncbi:ABC transporter substrate-binding protein [Nonomuraea sp. JJY05]|uniref:ABC transporter substrate-binding protein n=1 Tax=Nonomuraea sp. JJY05 TaxID=3350255 RepID=UPI00373FA0FB